MNSAANMLLHLVADLMRDAMFVEREPLVGLIAEFKEKPEGVMARRGLDGEARLVLMSMDRQILGERLRTEVLALEPNSWSSANRGGCQLLPLIADLIRADSHARVPSLGNLVKLFESEPERVMDAYGLDATGRDVLRSRDRQAIAEYLRQELLQTPSSTQDLWADPIPSVTVDTKTLVTAPNQKLKLTVSCAFSDAEVHLQSDDGFNHLIAKLSPPQPLRLMKQDVEVTFDLSSAKPDDYRVLVYNGRTLGPIVGDETVSVVESK